MEDYDYYYEENNYGEEDYQYTINTLERQNSYQVVKNTDIEKLRNNIILECCEFTCLSIEEATIVLIQYQWNMERIKDQWYEDVDENSKICGLYPNKLSNINLAKNKVYPNNKECYICYAPKDETFFSLNCNHFFCGECWANYIETCLDDIFTCISSLCPQAGCNLIVPEKIFKNFLNKDKIIEFEKCIYKNFTDNNVDIKWCPTPNCEMCIRSISHLMKEITCECKNVFCFKCGKEGHRPCNCELIEAWTTKNNSESENIKWLQANTKQCPSCHKFIEKNQGCNHMTCRKEAGGCGYEFCWICLDVWSTHGASYYECNKFQNNKEEDKETSRKQAKFELEDYIWHFDRFINHEKSQKHSVKLRLVIQEEISKFNKIKNLPYDELKFMEDAVESIIKSRRTLKNTYIFGFYMKRPAFNWKNDKNKLVVQEGKKRETIRKLFEHNQCLLEQNLEKLHGMMENDSKSKILGTCNYETFQKEWNNFKANVTNLSSVTLKYQENLLNEIENKMMDALDYKNIK
jgi:ariadne-1